MTCSSPSVASITVVLARQYSSNTSVLFLGIYNHNSRKLLFSSNSKFNKHMANEIAEHANNMAKHTPTNSQNNANSIFSATQSSLVNRGISCQHQSSLSELSLGKHNETIWKIQGGIILCIESRNVTKSDQTHQRSANFESPGSIKRLL